MLAMGQMPWYAYGDVVNEHGEGSSPTWQPVFIADHSHWARLLVPDGEAVFGQVADPPPSCHNLSSFGDPANGPIADLSQHRGNTFMFAEVSMLEKLQSSASLVSGVCAVMTKSWENWEADELVWSKYGLQRSSRAPRAVSSSARATRMMI